MNHDFQPTAGEMTSQNDMSHGIDDGTATELLVRLVGVPSPSTDESQASRFLVETMQRIGFDQADVDEAGNAVGVRQGSDTGPVAALTIMLLGHIDTVSGWIPPRVEGDLFFGRGAVDAKGPLAAMTVAAARARIAPGVRVVVVGAVEEEAASSKGARHIATQFRPDVCVIGEPSGWDACTLGYKGRLMVDYGFEQDEGHWAGQRVAAGEIAIGWWNQLQDQVRHYNRDRTKLFEQLLLALRSFQTRNDGLKDRVEVQAGLRIPVGFDRVAFESQVRAMAGSAEVQFRGYEEAWQSPRTSILATAFGAAIRQLGQVPRQKLKTGTSDMNVVGPIWNCPIVAYGPGDSGLDHAPNEHIRLSEYLKSINVLQTVIESLPVLSKSREPGEG